MAPPERSMMSRQTRRMTKYRQAYMKQTAKPERRGRKSRLEWPEPIDASPEEIARVVLNTKPPERWQYLEDERERLKKQREAREA